MCGLRDHITASHRQGTLHDVLLPRVAKDAPVVSLFDPAPLTVEQPDPEPLSADRRRTIRHREALDRGVHPVSGRPLRGSGICGDCVNHEVNGGAQRPYHKCRLNNTSGAATDIRVSWPACNAYEENKP